MVLEITAIPTLLNPADRNQAESLELGGRVRCGDW